MNLQKNGDLELHRFLLIEYVNECGFGKILLTGCTKKQMTHTTHFFYIVKWNSRLGLF